MAKKKVTTTVEEVEEAPIDYEKDLKDKSFEQIATETPKETPKEEVKEEPKEEPKEEKQVEAPREEAKFDPEAFKKETVDQGKNDILESLKGDTQKETDKNVSDYQKYQEEFLSKNNRQPTWFEVAEFMEEKALHRLEEKQAEKIKAQEEETTKLKEVETKNNEATNKYVKDTLDELYTNEKLPQIANKEDKDDYGQRVQNALLSKVVEVNTKRIEQGFVPKTIKEVYYEDFEIPAKEVAGANAPVNMGRGGYTPDDSQQLDYVKDISGPRNSFRNILSRAVKRG